MTASHERPELSPQPADPAAPAGLQSDGRLPTSVLLVAGGALLVLIGAFLPWVTILGFGISGVDTDYGIITLLIAAFALVAAFGAGRIFSREKANLFLRITAGLGVLALGLALYVGFALRDNIAEDEGGSEASATEEDLGDFGEALEGFARALRPKTGVGVYATALGGVLMAAGGLSNRRPQQPAA